jgi:hypothetical protein
MFCSSCGVTVAQGLSYCKSCGAKLSRGDDDYQSSEVKPDLLVAAMVATFIFGLAAITILIGVMKAVLGLPDGTILGFMVLPFLVMLVLEGVFIRLLLRRTRATQALGDARLLKDQATNELDPAQARALPEGMASVTEHTTRAFDPIYSERKQSKNAQ